MAAALLQVATTGTPGASATATAAPNAPATATWQQQSPIPTRYNLNAVDMVSATEGWAVGEYATILHTTDGGFTWASQTPAIASSEPVYSVSFVDSLHGVAGSNNTVLYTSNGGATWSAGSGPVGSMYNVEMSDATHAFASNVTNGIYKSSDGGRTWALQSMSATVAA